MMIAHDHDCSAHVGDRFGQCGHRVSTHDGPRHVEGGPFRVRLFDERVECIRGGIANGNRVDQIGSEAVGDDRTGLLRCGRCDRHQMQSSAGAHCEARTELERLMVGVCLAVHSDHHHLVRQVDPCAAVDHHDRSLGHMEQMAADVTDMVLAARLLRTGW